MKDIRGALLYQTNGSSSPVPCLQCQPERKLLGKHRWAWLISAIFSPCSLSCSPTEASPGRRTRQAEAEGQVLSHGLCSWQGLLATAAQKWKSLLPPWGLGRRTQHLPSGLLQTLSLLPGMISPATPRLLSLPPLERGQRKSLLVDVCPIPLLLHLSPLLLLSI